MFSTAKKTTCGKDLRTNVSMGVLERESVDFCVLIRYNKTKYSNFEFVLKGWYRYAGYLHASPFQNHT